MCAQTPPLVPRCLGFANQGRPVGRPAASSCQPRVLPVASPFLGHLTNKSNVRGPYGSNANLMADSAKAIGANFDPTDSLSAAAKIPLTLLFIRRRMQAPPPGAPCNAWLAPRLTPATFPGSKNSSHVRGRQLRSPHNCCGFATMSQSFCHTGNSQCSRSFSFRLLRSLAR